MERLTVRCVNCDHSWETAIPFSVYEQQALESCPCSHCGAYTLCVDEPQRIPGKPHKLRKLASVGSGARR